MAYDYELMRIARREQERRVFAYKQERANLRERLYTLEPRLKELDESIRLVFVDAISRLSPGVVDAAAAQSLALQEERAALLVAIGAKPDDLDEKPLCHLCGDKGRIRQDYCGCVLERYRRLQASSLSSVLDMTGQGFDCFDIDLYQGTARQNMEGIFELCRNYCQTFAPNSDNLVFSGSPGTGKTFMSACIAGDIGAQGFSVVYDTAARQLKTEEALHFGRGDEEAERHSRRLRSCDLLIIDDLGAEFPSPFGQSALLDIINLRLISRKKTVVSTNLDKGELERRYSPPLYSRLAGQFLWLHFFGEDLRLGDQ